MNNLSQANKQVAERDAVSNEAMQHNGELQRQLQELEAEKAILKEQLETVIARLGHLIILLLTVASGKVSDLYQCCSYVYPYTTVHKVTDVSLIFDWGFSTVCSQLRPIVRRTIPPSMCSNRVTRLHRIREESQVSELRAKLRAKSDRCLELESEVQDLKDLVDRYDSCMERDHMY